MMIRVAVLGIAACVFLLPSGIRTASPFAQPPFACPTSASANPPHMILPEPYTALPDQPGMFWYGSPALWTRLLANGHWGGLYRADLNGYRNKLFVWRPGYDPRAEPVPDLTVTARRLDASAPEYFIAEATNAFASDIGSSMLTAPNIPTDGCWELTAHYGAETLTFVVVVP